MARTPVLPRATPVGALSAQPRRSQPRGQCPVNVDSGRQECANSGQSLAARRRAQNRLNSRHLRVALTTFLGATAFQQEGGGIVLFCLEPESAPCQKAGKLRRSWSLTVDGNLRFATRRATATQAAQSHPGCGRIAWSNGGFRREILPQLSDFRKGATDGAMAHRSLMGRGYSRPVDRACDRVRCHSPSPAHEDHERRMADHRTLPSGPRLVALWRHGAAKADEHV